MKEQTREEPKILAAAERRMQAWVFAEQIAERTLRVDSPEPCTARLGDYVTISREAGACGGEIAQLIGQKLGWEVLDKNLLDQIADRCRASRSTLELIDEKASDWPSSLFGSWLDRKVIPHEKYVAHLSRIVVAAARRGNVVLVGRGAQFLLPRDQGLAVRIIAPEKYRVAQIMRRHGLTEGAARRFVVEVDQARREFVGRFFHRNIDDPHLYDLVINVERLGPAATAEQIIDAYRR